MKNQRYPALAGSLLLALLFAWATLSAAPRLQAAPEAPSVQGGVFTVNSNTDANTSNSFLTLREALLLARGGTGASGLNRALSASEQALLSGCTISGGLITGGCGTGITNTIVFNMGVPTIVLGSPLPVIDNGAPTIIDGNLLLVHVTIDASGLAAGQNGLNVLSDYNTIRYLAVTGAARDGISVIGNNNTISGTTVANNGFNGVDLSGSWNVVYGNNVLTNTVSGIRLYGASTNNYIGCTRLCAIDSGNVVNGNLASGIELTTTSTAFNLISANQIGAAPGNGILVNAAYNNTVQRNVIQAQGKAGIRVSGDAFNNIIGGPSAANGNGVRGNNQEGILLTGLETRFNRVDGNMVATNTIGIRVYIGHDNTIGSTGSNRNTVIQNDTDGIMLDEFAYSNTVGINYVGTDSIGHNLGNLRHGLAIVNSYNNVIGPNVWANAFFNNGGEGILITGTASYGNHVSGNEMRFNSGNGMRLDGGAHDNAIGTGSDTNYIANNNGDGVLIVNSHGNTLVGNDVAFNTRNGVELNGNGAYDNKLDGGGNGTIRSNTLDGVNSRNGAANNWWTNLAVFSSGGLGIDMNAPSDSTNTPTAPLPAITSATFNGDTTTLHGTATPSSASQTVTVDVFSLGFNRSGYGEGGYFLDTATVNNAGVWSLTLVGSQGITCFTAYQTIYVPGNFTRDSSEFGPNSCRVMLPVIRR